MKDLLIMARNQGADVFNALDLTENKSFLELLHFGAGDGYLQYYVYNWKSPVMKAEDVGLVLLWHHYLLGLSLKKFYISIYLSQLEILKFPSKGFSKSHSVSW